MDEDAVCYFRPFLRKTYTFTDKDGNVCFLGEPEIFHDLDSRKPTALAVGGMRHKKIN